MKTFKLLFLSAFLICFFAIVLDFGKPAEGMAKRRALAPEYFAVYTATLDGKKFTEVLRDKKRQLSHVRVSPDKKWLTFTRFNKYNSAGVAIEENGYLDTEIMLSRIDGSGTQELVPRKQKQVNCNSYWTPDGKGVIYFSSENPEKLAQIYIKDITLRKRTRMPIPNKGVHATDPFLRGDLVVYPVKRPGKTGDSRIWIMRKDGKNARQLSGVRAVSYGDFDPKISPDMSRVAFYRYKSKKGEAGGVDLVMIDIKTGIETILSKPGNNDLDAMPEWSSDGNLLVFWHINRTDFKKTGIYTIRPDGTERKMVPLPKGYFYTMPSFFPGEGSGKNARIIFSARKLNPNIVKKIWGDDK